MMQVCTIREFDFQSPTGETACLYQRLHESTNLAFRDIPLRERAHYTRRAIRLVWQAAGLWSVLWLVLLVIQGLVPTGIVYMTKWVMDAVNEAIGQGVSREQVMVVLSASGYHGRAHALAAGYGQCAQLREYRAVHPRKRSPQRAPA